MLFQGVINVNTIGPHTEKKKNYTNDILYNFLMFPCFIKLKINKTTKVPITACSESGGYKCQPWSSPSGPSSCDQTRMILKLMNLNIINGCGCIQTVSKLFKHIQPSPYRQKLQQPPSEYPKVIQHYQFIQLMFL